MIPFEATRFTRSIYPLKLNEYLAAGRPVVDDAVRAARRRRRAGLHRLRHGGLLARARPPRSATRARDARARRIAFARQNTWAAPQPRAFVGRRSSRPPRRTASPPDMRRLLASLAGLARSRSPRRRAAPCSASRASRSSPARSRPRLRRVGALPHRRHVFRHAAERARRRRRSCSRRRPAPRRGGRPRRRRGVGRVALGRDGAVAAGGGLVVAGGVGGRAVLAAFRGVPGADGRRAGGTPSRRGRRRPRSGSGACSRCGWR